MTSPTQACSQVVELALWVFQNSTTSSQTIAADNRCTYELKTPNSRFRDLTSQEGMQDRIQIQVEEGKIIYLITGIQTALNQCVEVSENSKLSGSGSVSFDPYTVPMDKSLNANDSNLDARASHLRSKDTELSMSTDRACRRRPYP